MLRSESNLLDGYVFVGYDKDWSITEVECLTTDGQ